MRTKCAAALAALQLVLIAHAAAASDLLLRPKGRVDPALICARHGLQLVQRLDDKRAIYLVKGPDSLTPADLAAMLAADRDIQNIEFSVPLNVVEEPGAAPLLQQSIATVLEKYGPKQLARYYGSDVWDRYLTQYAADRIAARATHRDYSTGTSVTVAVIDTGVDPNHPALRGHLVPGYDFTRELPGLGSEWLDLDQSIATVLEQSIATVLEGSRAVLLNASTAAVLEDSIADTTARTLQSQVPDAFGHGTMVAGLVHMAAPTAKIMPLKAFAADGSSSLFHVIRAIYYAADHGAKVINMSFSLPYGSRELVEAINYANRRGATCVAATGNNGQPLDLYPAALKNTFGIGSTGKNDHRSTFSNYGAEAVTIGAPGEAVITPYPGGRYAVAWGTSFSSAIVSGGIAVLLDINPDLALREMDRALSQAKLTTSMEGLGYGRLDLYRAADYVFRRKKR